MHERERFADPPGEAGTATAPRAVPTAESAECTCPDFCERDHDID